MKDNLKQDPYYYEKLGNDFNKFMSDYDVSRRIDLIFNYLLDHIQTPENASVLEIGCGTGKISAQICQRPWKLTVNDISDKLCQGVAETLNCAYLAGDCQQLACKDESFDIIISSECIEHTLDPWAALKEMHRVLKKNGYLIVTTPNKIWFPVLQIANLLQLRRFNGIEHWTWPSALKNWLKQNGFSDIRFGGCHLFPWQLPLAKHVLPFFDKSGNILYPIMINYGFLAKK